MDSISTAEHIEHLIAEYRSMLKDVSDSTDDGSICALLVQDAEWTNNGAATILALAKQYGTFVLANALALAEALDIEDGEAGL